MKNVITIDKYPLTQDLVDQSIAKLHVNNINHTENISATKIHNILRNNKDSARLIYDTKNNPKLSGDNIIIISDQSLDNNLLLEHLQNDQDLLKKIRKIILLCINNPKERDAYYQKKAKENSFYKNLSKKIVTLSYDEETIHCGCDSDIACSEQISKTIELKKLIAQEIENVHSYKTDIRDKILKIIAAIKSEFSEITKYQRDHNRQYEPNE